MDGEQRGRTMRAGGAYATFAKVIGGAVPLANLENDGPLSSNLPLSNISA